MDTSKDYYESVMRNFKTYGRGRTLEVYCRDEGIVAASPDTPLPLLPNETIGNFSKITDIFILIPKPSFDSIN